MILRTATCQATLSSILFQSLSKFMFVCTFTIHSHSLCSNSISPTCCSQQKCMQASSEYPSPSYLLFHRLTSRTHTPAPHRLPKHVRARHEHSFSNRGEDAKIPHTGHVVTPPCKAAKTVVQSYGSVTVDNRQQCTTLAAPHFVATA